MDFSREALKKLFPNTLVRGSVFRTTWVFPDGQQKPKFLILLNARPREDALLLFFLTTSQTEFFKKNPHIKDLVHIQPGDVSFLPLLTIVDCRQVIKSSKSDWEERYLGQRLECPGALPAHLVEKIDSIVMDSKLISPRDKNIIFG
ncbi:MAG: hypothetical protein AAB091_06845 [Elusimicrobiota bacterium]